MSTGALVFMVGSWVFVLGLAGWSYARVLRSGASASGGSTPEEKDSEAPR